MGKGLGMERFGNSCYSKLVCTVLSWPVALSMPSVQSEYISLTVLFYFEMCYSVALLLHTHTFTARDIEVLSL